MQAQQKAYKRWSEKVSKLDSNFYILRLADPALHAGQLGLLMCVSNSCHALMTLLQTVSPKYEWEVLQQHEGW
jgi:hypothetical protein